jgi:hypothetical protein
MFVYCYVAGEGVLLGLTAHASSAVVSTAHLSALKLQATDLQQLMHPADLQVRQGAWLGPQQQLVPPQPEQQAETENWVSGLDLQLAVAASCSAKFANGWPVQSCCKRPIKLASHVQVSVPC